MSDGVRIFTLPDVSHAEQSMTGKHAWSLSCLSACLRHLDLQVGLAFSYLLVFAFLLGSFACLNVQNLSCIAVPLLSSAGRA